MNHHADKKWTRSEIPDEQVDGNEVTTYTAKFDGCQIIIKEYINDFGGKTVAYMHHDYEPPSDNNMYMYVVAPTISIWCTGASTQQIVDYLLEAKKRLDDHRLTYHKFICQS